MSAWAPADLEKFPRHAPRLLSASTSALPDAGRRISSPARSEVSRASRASKANSQASRGSRASRAMSGPPGSQRHAIDRSGPPSVRSSSGASSGTASGRAYHNLTSKLPSFMPNVGNFSITALPGYTGWVPAKAAENVVGATYHRANELACVAAASRADPPLIGGRRTNPWGMGERPGIYVPGYTGYIPGKEADNVFGHTYGRENEVAQLIKHQHAADEQCRVNAYRQGQRPPTGHLDYSGYHAYGSGSGLDSTG